VEEKQLRWKKSQLIVSNQVVTNACCGLAVIFCSFILLLIGCKTINNPEIFPGVHSFKGMTVKKTKELYYLTEVKGLCVT